MRVERRLQGSLSPEIDKDMSHMSLTVPRRRFPDFQGRGKGHYIFVGQATVGYFCGGLNTVLRLFVLPWRA